MSVLVETNDRGWILDRYDRPKTIVAALWAIYGDHAKVVLEWLLDKPRIGA